MALQLSIYIPAYRVIASYWRFGHIDMRIDRGIVVLRLDGFVAREHRDDPEGLPVTQRVFTVEGANFAQLLARHYAGENIAALAYEYVRHAWRIVPGRAEPLPSEFADAVNV
ncbi:hypothetical protein C7S18_12235 [Ahniella affigens]|uniref:Uncharacterized protein n=1 Tax=Ahniella affigens TaxID=2021234 RepID=A0A2P1PSX6_9GAMM|nr:hypothetical protein [Ahniella affigens]AVP97920.1 hypothetical protein C7S18_12235 [Ahniella affigens]